MMAKKAEDTPSQKESKAVVVEGKSKQRIQTAEGWKRSQLKQRKQSKE